VNPKNFFAELKRREGYKKAIASLLFQIATQIFPRFEF
jgi:hypothetical protein